MKRYFARLLIGLTLIIGCGAASAQPAPNVQSIDILKQDQVQASQSQPQPASAAPVYRQIVDGEEHYTSIPSLEAGVLIQPKAQFPGQDRATTAGEAWRQYRNGPLTAYGGILLILTALFFVALYFIKGTIKLKGKPTGRLIERFTSVERMVHWTVAITFVILAVSGLTMLFGKYVLLPVFGYHVFGAFSYVLKTIHNFVGPIFTLSLIVFFVIYVRDNLPHPSDLRWLARGGGLLGGGHVSSGRFNAGEKIWFWLGLVALGLVVSVTGFVLDMLVPGISYTRGNMQIANILHIVSTVLMMAMSIGHIYMGTVGMEGAYKAMRTGYVDDTWAKEHHDLWYEDVQSGKVPRVRTEEAVVKSTPPVKA
jgi:formate dehydrogenase subunit gamma